MVACKERDQISEIASSKSDEEFELKVGHFMKLKQCRIIKEGTTVVVTDRAFGMRCVAKPGTGGCLWIVTEVVKE